VNPQARDGPHARLAELGLELPALRPYAGNYVGWRRSGSQLLLAGQGADVWVGRVGADYSVTQAQGAARDCMLNLLAQTNDALGSLDRVAAVLKVLGFVACTEETTDLPGVLDGASDLLVGVFSSC